MNDDNSPLETEPVKWVEALNFPPKEPVPEYNLLPEPDPKVEGTATYIGQVTQGNRLKIMCLAPVTGGSATALPASFPSSGPVKDASTIAGAVIPRPPEVIRGALYKGSILGIGGASKSHKTFGLIDLCVSVATGKPFWGLNTTQGRVIYVNMELQDFELSSRLCEILSARSLSLGSDQMGVWNLRGQTIPIETIVATLSRYYSKKDISLIVIDPIYKCYGHRDENSASQMTSLFGELERLAAETGAAVAFAAHYAKGDSSTKAAIDRISGSGVFARYPDALFAVTEDKFVPNKYNVETILRNFKEIPTFSLEWTYPLMCLVPPSAVRAVSHGIGRPPKYNLPSFLHYATAKPLTGSSWQTSCGMSDTTFKKFLKAAQDSTLIGTTAAGEYFVKGSAADPEKAGSKTPILVETEIDIF